MKRSSRFLSVAAAAVLLWVAAPGAVSAQTSRDLLTKGEPHCLVETGGQKLDGELIVTGTTCFDTFPEVLRRMGVDAVADDVTPRTLDRAVVAAMGIIAVHYDGNYYSGASISVSGDVCNGGWINLSPGWNDRISSTLSGCQVQHYLDINLSGGYVTTFAPGGSLNGTSANNKVSSIRYW